MNRYKRILPALLATALALAGCAASTKTPIPGETRGDQLVVVASFATMADFSEKIGGDRCEVITLVPAGAEPHDWEPAAQDIARLEMADMLVLSGAGFEHWVEGVVPTLKNTGLRVVEAAAGIDLLAGHGHDDHDHDDDDHDHGTDPHVWLDPRNAKTQLRNIRDALCELDPEGEAWYSAAYDEYADQLDALDAEYRATLSALPGREIVVAHEAYGYLCAAYGLEQVAAQGLSPEGEPDPAQMARVIEYARSHTVQVIFFEEAASPKVAEAIAREIGAATAVLSPLESISQEQLDAGEDYFTIMRRNLGELEAALA